MNDGIGEIILGRQAWLPWALGVFLLLTLIGLLSYRGVRSVRVLATGLLLRSIGLATLLFCMLEPMRSLRVPKPQANTIAVLVDNSRSMRSLYQRPLQGSEKPRDSISASDLARESADAMKGVDRRELVDSFCDSLDEQSPWFLKLAEQFRIRRYLFGQSLEAIEGLGMWTGMDNHSNIEGAIQSLIDRYPNQPPSGILLISDGRSTVKERFEGSGDSEKRISIPVYPVVIHAPSEKNRDLWIEDLSVRTSDFETAPVSVQIKLGNRGLEKGSAVVVLDDLQHKRIETKQVVLGEGGKTTSVRFQFRPEKSGAQGYRVSCWMSPDENRRELTLENNHRFLSIDRGIGPYRVLYLAGRPNWEYKFLQRALSDDAEIVMTSLIRIAKKEPKFSFRNKKMEDTNPLFSGFEDVSEEEKEKYNEPVFARLGVVKSGELATGFPKDAEELFSYSAIIIDDLEQEFFTIDQLQLLRQFVSQRGGTLLVLGGQESLRGRGFRDSVLGQLLPVYGDAEEPDMIIPQLDQTPTDAIRLGLTREGWLLPYLRLSDNEEDERKRIEKMPGFYVWNRTSQTKAGSRVLLEGEFGNGEKVPVLVVQKFGKGTTGSLLVGDLWRWGLMDRESGPSPFYQSWRQLIRGLIVDVPRRLSVTTQVAPGQPSKRLVRVQVRDEKYNAQDNARVSLRIETPQGEPLQMKVHPSEEVSGVYETSIAMRDSGVYRVFGEAANKEGEPIGEAETAFVYEPEAIELLDCHLDEERLKRLAAETEGALIPSGSMENIVDRISIKHLQHTEQRIEPLWHSPWWLIVALGFLGAEWWWRRRNGMA